MISSKVKSYKSESLHINSVCFKVKDFEVKADFKSSDTTSFIDIVIIVLMVPFEE